MTIKKNSIIIIVFILIISVFITFLLYINSSNHCKNNIINKYKNSNDKFNIIINYINDNLDESTSSFSIINTYDKSKTFNAEINQRSISITDDTVNEAIYYLFSNLKFDSIIYYQNAGFIQFIYSRGTRDFSNGIMYTCDKFEKLEHGFTLIENIEDNIYYFESDYRKRQGNGVINSL